jgi:hypothetical protein
MEAPGMTDRVGIFMPAAERARNRDFASLEREPSPSGGGRRDILSADDFQA